MKKTNILFWSITGLFAAFMLFSSIPDILVVPDAKTFMNHLGYPDYFIPFIGWMKVLGIVAILIPGFPRITEWAYAGLFFDLMGATFSVGSVEGIKPEMLFMVLPMVFLFASHHLYHKRLAARSAQH